MKGKILNFLCIFFTTSFYFGLSKTVVAEKEIGGVVLEETKADNVEVTQKEGTWTDRDGNQYPRIYFTMNSGRFIYSLRYELEYGKGTIGLEEPTLANWYQSGMLSLYLNGERFDLFSKNNKGIDTESGKKGKVSLSWGNEKAKVNYNFVLFAGDDKLFMEIEIEPKIEIREIKVHLINYPGGFTWQYFNRSPEHILYTPIRKIESKGWCQLAPEKENCILYTDNFQDVATNPKGYGPSALLFDNSQVENAKVFTGSNYGVSTILEYKPTTRRLLFCFWEFPRKTNNEALKYLKESVSNAKKIMNDPNTFLWSYERW